MAALVQRFPVLSTALLCVAHCDTQGKMLVEYSPDDSIFRDHLESLSNCNERHFIP
jgi:hypothetical protein